MSSNNISKIEVRQFHETKDNFAAANLNKYLESFNYEKCEVIKIDIIVFNGQIAYVLQFSSLKEKNIAVRAK